MLPLFSGRIIYSRKSVKMRILIADIETFPSAVWTWGLWKQDISLPQIQTPGAILCWAASWLGEKRVHYDSVQNKPAKEMLSGIYDLLSRADLVVTWNGDRFDLRVLRREFVLHGFTPLLPAASLDLLKTARKQFAFLSNKLEFVAKAIGCRQKTKPLGGFSLWTQVMAGDALAWRRMRKYCVNDVRVLEDVYKRLLPWVTSHPNTGLYEGKPVACPSCGGVSLESRGHAFTKASKYRRFRCRGCGSWSRSTKRESGTNVTLIM